MADECALSRAGRSLQAQREVARARRGKGGPRVAPGRRRRESARDHSCPASGAPAACCPTATGRVRARHGARPRRSPPPSFAAAVTPEATPGATSNSRAKAWASSSADSIPWCASCRAQTRARTLAGGWRSSRANIMRRKRTGLVRGAAFDVHRIGTGVSSRSLFMNTFEPAAESAGTRRDPDNAAHTSASLDSRSSISSKSRIERRSPASRRWASRSSCSRSRREGSSLSASDSPTT